MLLNTCLCWLNITRIVHSSFFVLSLNAAACSFTANSLIVSLKNSLPKLKFGNGAFCVTHVQDGKTLVINFYFLLVPEIDFILISFLLIKEQKKREREIRPANLSWKSDR